eukprot:TRINITY_DN1195_c0_g1_i1.p1 TRINITY_DN1195_c0_g1~~TRINITY_DN1195_c0_g1_i1.p1  ORF type:complete len:186 (-),score=1.22 TRINITY_DN1195_c0_g1_i1:109-666(-)
MERAVLVPVANGSEDIEAVTIIDTLRRAGANVTVASVEETLQVTFARGVKIVADALLSDCKANSYHLIVLPGGIPGAERLRDSKLLIELLHKQNKENKLVGAICASPAVVLESHGLLKGHKATCYPSYADKLSDKSEAGEKVVVSKNLITGQAVASALQFSLKLVEQLYDKKKAQEVAEKMLARM